MTATIIQEFRRAPAATGPHAHHGGARNRAYHHRCRSLLPSHAIQRHTLHLGRHPTPLTNARRPHWPQLNIGLCGPAPRDHRLRNQRNHRHRWCTIRTDAWLYRRQQLYRIPGHQRYRYHRWPGFGLAEREIIGGIPIEPHWFHLLTAATARRRDASRERDPVRPVAFETAPAGGGR